MPFKRKKVPTVLSIFALLLGGGIITSCSSNNSQIDNNSLASVKFEDESVTVRVGDIIDITPFLSADASLSDFDVILSNQNITYEINGETISITGVSDGLTTLTLRAKDQGAFEDSILIVVAPSDSSMTDYVLEADTSKAKTEFLLNDTFTTDDLKVYAYKYEDGLKDENTRLVVNDYSIEVEGGTVLDTLGERKVTITSDVFGTCSYAITVGESVRDEYITIDTSGASTSFNQGDYFSSNGLVVTVHSEITSLDETGNKITSSESSVVSNYTTNYGINYRLSNCGIFNVDVSYGKCEPVSYQISVSRSDSTIRDTVSTFVNTRDMSVEVNTTIPNDDSFFGSAFNLNFKPNYVLKTEYEKVSSTEVNKETVNKESGVLLDKNRDVISYVIENDNVVLDQLIKDRVTSYWDYLQYSDISSFKEFAVKDFPQISMSDESGYYYEAVNPEEGSDNYQTSLSSYPIVQTAFKISDTSTSLFRFVDYYELIADGLTIEIKVHVNGYGEISIKTIEHGTNVDDERVLEAVTNQDFEISSEISSEASLFKDSIQENNYSITSTLGTTYFHDKYYYVTYTNPLAILAGLYSQGYVAVKDSENNFEGDGIYNFRANEDSDLIVSSIRDEEVTPIYQDTSTIKYSDMFTDFISSYISTAFKELFSDNTLLATFEEIGTTGIYMSKNADVSEMYLDHFVGSSGDNRDTAESNGYIFGAFQLEMAGNTVSSITLLLLNSEFYGYVQNLENIGQVHIAAIEEYFNI